MARYIALLRGINVGGNKSVPMATLRELLAAAGYSEVATLLQSGNAVFTSPERSAAKLGHAIEQALKKELGFEVKVLLRTREELARVIQANPLDKAARKEPSRVLVTFLAEPLGAARLAPIAKLAQGGEELHAKGSELYTYFPQGMGRSKLGTALAGPKLGVVATGRNWATLTKLLALADAV